MEIEARNIRNYLLDKTDLFNKNDPIEIKELSLEAGEPEAEGYVNFVFRVSQGRKNYILKQARPYLKHTGIANYLPEGRNYLEYVSYLLRKGIAGNSVPQVFFVDTDNHMFLMEDLGAEDLKIMRFQLNEGREFKNFPEQIGTFLARCHFYTSRLYLNSEVFQSLSKKFENSSMRAVMENIVLSRSDSETDLENNDDGQLFLVRKRLGDKALENVELSKALDAVKDNFIKKGECLVHGDLHTSNLFVNVEKLFVIDMEYSFMAPFSYDLGYLLANFVSQYAAFSYNTRFTLERRKDYKLYLLDTIHSVLTAYFKCFRECFGTEAKEEYKNMPGYLDELFEDITRELSGVMAAANFYRIVGPAPFPDFDVIFDNSKRTLAYGLSIAIDEYLLFNSPKIKTPELLVEAIRTAEKGYVK